MTKSEKEIKEIYSSKQDFSPDAFGCRIRTPDGMKMNVEVAMNGEYLKKRKCFSIADGKDDLLHMAGRYANKVFGFRITKILYYVMIVRYD